VATLGDLRCPRPTMSFPSMDSLTEEGDSDERQISIVSLKVKSLLMKESTKLRSYLDLDFELRVESSATKSRDFNSSEEQIGSWNIFSRNGLGVVE
jgi:hypothetical protein